MTLLGTAVGLGSKLEALAALAAHVRVTNEDVEVDPRLRALLADVAQELLGDEGTDGPAGAAVVGMTRALLSQAQDLVDHPERAGGWAAEDASLVQSMGRQSMSIIDAFRVAAGALDGLGAALAAPGARFLDVGTGAGWLAITLARTRPDLHVVGLDILEPPLALARANVAEAGLEGQVELRRHDITTLEEDSSYDAVWLPLPFLPEAIVPAALDSARRVLRPGGWLLAGTFAGPPDRLGRLLVDVRTVRSGGHPWTPAELVELIEEHGFAGAAELPRTWSAPVGLHVGRRSELHQLVTLDASERRRTLLEYVDPAVTVGDLTPPPPGVAAGPVGRLAPFVDVRDVSASVAFYGLLGFAVVGEHHTGDGRLVWASLRSGTAELMLNETDEPVDATGQGVLFYLFSDDLAGLRAHLRANGETPSEIADGSPGPSAEMRVDDPDGYCLMIAATA